MTGFRRDAQQCAMLGGVRIRELLAHSELETPAYFYDLDGVRDTSRALKAAFGPASHLLAYAMKANSAGSILRTLAGEGVGADVVSGAELEVALGASIPADRIVMSGVAKTDAELDQAIAVGVYAIQLESLEEIPRVAARARAQGRMARVAVRVNPGIEIGSHAHIRTGHDAAKFGISAADVDQAFARIDSEPDWLAGVGISTHIGSMLATPEPLSRAARLVAELARARRAAARSLDYVNFGGGFGIDYGDQPCDPPERFVEAALAVQSEFELGDLRLVLEPGRALVAPFGVLVAKVVQSKVSGERRWLMIDAGMNDLLRPALYAAHHRIEPLDFAPGSLPWRVVGPVCESSDDFGAHPFGERIPELVVIRDAGAYGFVMASEYNGRPLPSEVFVESGAILSVSRALPRADWVTRRLSA